jgi:hypothetical protein
MIENIPAKQARAGALFQQLPRDGIGNPVPHGARGYTSVGKNVSELWGGSMDKGHADFWGSS